jgi:hypothetical protein
MILPDSRPPYRAAPSNRIAVVAARTQGGVYRAVDFTYWSELRRTNDLVHSIVYAIGSGSLAEVEWTGYVYELPPRYVMGIAGSDWRKMKLYERSGVYFHRWAMEPKEPSWSGSSAAYGLISDDAEFLMPLIRVERRAR